MNKLKEWLLNIDDENIDNDYVLRKLFQFLIFITITLFRL